MFFFSFLMVAVHSDVERFGFVSKLCDVTTAGDPSNLFFFAGSQQPRFAFYIAGPISLFS